MRRPFLTALALAFAACTPSSDEGPGGNGGNRNVEFIDEDGDGFFVNAVKETDRDCDDFQPQVYPGREEICNGVDDDCNRLVDDNASGALEWYLDRDGDGFGVPLRNEIVLACSRPRGYSGNGRDCNDADPFIYRGAPERCNGLDDNCDPNQLVDEGLDFNAEWYADRDRDGYGGGQPVGTGCSTDPTWVLNNLDCNDVLDSVNPDAPEICDNIDNDCDNAIDDADDDIEGARRYYNDADGDGYGSVLDSRIACILPPGFVSNSTDCNDDPDADGALQSPETIWYQDNDRDGHGNGRVQWPYAQCWQPIGYALDTLDCDDADGSVWTGAEWHPDADRDGYGGTQIVGFGCESQPGWTLDAQDCDDRDPVVNPDNTETCNNEDDDCNGLIDDDDPDVQGRPLWYIDNDNDGYGRAVGATPSCRPIPGTADNGDDCNDSQAALNPDTIWYRDADRDTYGDPNMPSAPQCAILPGYVLNTNDCNDADPELNDFTRWYTDQDQDGLGVGITEARLGCPTNPRLSMESGDCDDTDPLENSGGCFGPQEGLVEVSVITDADALGIAVLAVCAGGQEALELVLGEGDANTTVVDAFVNDEGTFCGLTMLNATGDPSGDGVPTVELRVCGTLIDSFELVDPVTEFFPFQLTSCSGCYDPNAINFDPNVLVPNNEESCIY